MSNKPKFASGTGKPLYHPEGKPAYCPECDDCDTCEPSPQEHSACSPCVGEVPACKAGDHSCTPIALSVTITGLDATRCTGCLDDGSKGLKCDSLGLDGVHPLIVQSGADPDWKGNGGIATFTFYTDTSCVTVDAASSFGMDRPIIITVTKNGSDWEVDITARERHPLGSDPTIRIFEGSKTGDAYCNTGVTSITNDISTCEYNATDDVWYVATGGTIDIDICEDEAGKDWGSNCANPACADPSGCCTPNRVEAVLSGFDARVGCCHVNAFSLSTAHYVDPVGDAAAGTYDKTWVLNQGSGSDRCKYESDWSDWYTVSRYTENTCTTTDGTVNFRAKLTYLVENSLLPGYWGGGELYFLIEADDGTDTGDDNRKTFHFFGRVPKLLQCDGSDWFDQFDENQVSLLNPSNACANVDAEYAMYATVTFCPP